MNIWNLIRAAAARNAQLSIQTTMLGAVPYKTRDDGTLEAVVPPWVEDEADRYGLEVTAADYKTNSYYIRMTPNCQK